MFLEASQMEQVMFTTSFKLLAFGLSIVVGLAGADRAWAHCDGLDGPVVKAARAALESGDVNRALVWVREMDESEVRGVFHRALAVRKLGNDAKVLADTSLFETVVRLHRAAEGAPYTGLKPAGRDLGPAIPAADAALETGGDAALVRLLTTELEEGIRARLADARRKRGFDPSNVVAGREYVEAYVTLLNYVERLHEAIEHAPEHHFPQE
jgi:hypothetical protein